MTSAATIHEWLKDSPNYGGIYFYDGAVIRESNKVRDRVTKGLSRDLLERNQKLLFVVLQISRSEAAEGKVGHWCVAGFQSWFDPYGLLPDVGYRVVSGKVGDNMSKLFDWTKTGTQSTGALRINKTDYQTLSPNDNLCGVIAAAYVTSPNVFVAFASRLPSVRGASSTTVAPLLPSRVLTQEPFLGEINQILLRLKSKNASLPPAQQQAAHRRGQPPATLLQLLKRHP